MDQHSNRYLLADMLLIGRTLPEILMARGTLIFLLHLGFVINLRKVVLHPVKQIEFMGLVINTEKMTLALSEKKLKRVSTMSGDFHAAKNFSLKSDRVSWPVVINCPDHFTSTNAVSTGANISSTQKGSYSGHVALVNLAREELHWWMENLELCHGGKPETGTPYDHSDRCLNKRLGAYCKGFSAGWKWSKEEKHFHINVLELLALKCAILTFTKNLSHLSIHVQVENKLALPYFLKMGGTRSPHLLKISKSIWTYLLSHQITITAEYLPSRLNTRPDWGSECRNARLIRLETT